MSCGLEWPKPNPACGPPKGGVCCPPIQTMSCPCPGGCGPCGTSGGSCSPECCPPCSWRPTCNCLGDGQKLLEPCDWSKRQRREKRWKQCNFLKPCIDTRIYRNGEHLCISYAGHIPGEQFIHGRNLPTTTTFAKRRLCQYTPYEFIDPDGCCSFCTYPPAGC